MDDKKRLSAPLLAFDVMDRLARTSRKLHAQNPPPPPEAPRKIRKMAKKKPAPPPLKPKPKPAVDLSKVILNWKTEDQQLDFELTIDEDGDAQVSCFDADHDKPIDIAANLNGLNEVIYLLQTVRQNFTRIKGGDLRPADTENWKASEEEEESEEEDDELEEEEDVDE